MPAHQVHDGLAEAFTYAWENWDRMDEIDRPVGYLYRVRAIEDPHPPPGGSSRGRGDTLIPEVEPDLMPALRALPTMQQNAVWLVSACGWSQVEAAEALGVTPSDGEHPCGPGSSNPIRERLGATA